MKYFLIILPMLVITEISYSEIYKWTDKDGNIYFSDKRPAQYKAKQVNLKINTYTSVSFDSITSTATASKNVIMYSTSRCGYCKKAKAYFRKNNISFTEYDVEKDASAREQFKALGATGVPVILVGDKRMNGFSVSGFQRIYN